MANRNIFRRHEYKYLLESPQFDPLYARLQDHLSPDQYGRHTICTLYYDNEHDECANKQGSKTFFREKLRQRSYGVPAKEDIVYLELKKKLDGVTYKRRAALPLPLAQDYLARGILPQDAGQVLGEIDWFVKRVHPLPKTVICYDRIALQDKEDPNLRITFDENIRFRCGELDLTRGDHGRLLCAPGQVLMEIKITGPLPLWLARLLSQREVYPSSFSKFRAAYESAAILATAKNPAPAWPMVSVFSPGLLREGLHHA
ncbi:polyphosphate polymerase domain-containing protein [Ruminococcaceae bacterium OttesenSCG-928-I18]|nr:polyphosphate polymerase domain-containing protein [Ruminococcaceae bacterium OttesenSCG-928-I18]